MKICEFYIEKPRMAENRVEYARVCWAKQHSLRTMKRKIEWGPGVLTSRTLRPWDAATLNALHFALRQSSPETVIVHLIPYFQYNNKRRSFFLYHFNYKQLSDVCILKHFMNPKNTKYCIKSFHTFCPVLSHYFFQKIRRKKYYSNSYCCSFAS